MYSVELKTTIKDVDRKDWNRLVHDVYMSYGWLQTVEETFISPVDYLYFLVLAEGRLVGGAVCNIHYPTNSVYTLDDLIFGRFKGPALRFRISVLPSLICGPTRGYGQHFLLDKNLTVSQRQEVILMLFNAMEQEASTRKLSITFNNVLTEEHVLMQLLEESGYSKTINFPLNFIDIQWSTFDEYKKILAKRKLVREINKNRKAGVIIRQLETVESCQDQLYELLAGNYWKYNSKPLMLHREFVGRCKKNLDKNAIVYIAEKKGKIIGTTILLHRRGIGYMADVGVDHAASGNDLTYFNIVFYRPIDDAIAMPLKRIYYGTMMYGLKANRGCSTMKTYLYYKPRFRLLQPIMVPLFKIHSRLKSWFISHLHA